MKQLQHDKQFSPSSGTRQKFGTTIGKNAIV